MSPKPPQNPARDPVLADVRLHVTALSAEYRMYRKANERFLVNAQKYLDGMWAALSRLEKQDDTGRVNVLRTSHKPLSKREIQILKLIAEGHGTKQAAQVLGIAFKTAVGHRSNLMTKLGLHDSVSLAKYAIRAGLIDA